MAKSIEEAQANGLKTVTGFNEDAFQYEPLDITVVNELLGRYGADFQQNLAAVMAEKNVVASGELSKTARVSVYQDKVGMEIYLNSYYDYPNQGVKGVNSSKNAPNSPYQYKNYGMSEDGRASIKKYIESGKAKISTIQNDKKGIQSSERKKMSLIDLQTQTLIFLIKKYGIKATHYLDIAIERTFKDLNSELAKQFKDVIILNIIK